MTVFLDTVGLIAVWDEDDQWHPAADSCFVRLLGERVDFVTTN
jgi:predicted nucleic acid-binding protein